MDGLAKFAMDQIEFDRLARSVGGVVEFGARLPAWPFRSQRAFSHVIEYDRVLGGDFAAVLVALAHAYGDHAVATVVFDPDVRYYNEAYGILPGFQVETASLEAGYSEGLRYEPGGDPTGALAYTANVIVIAGSSGQWALWGQRDWEIHSALHTARLRSVVEDACAHVRARPRSGLHPLARGLGCCAERGGTSRVLANFRSRGSGK